MLLFTVSASYDGGTYISQVRAVSVSQAVMFWAEQLEAKSILGLGPKSKAKLVEDLQLEREEGHGPVLLNGLVNAWCETALIRGKLMIMDIIQTDELKAP